MSTDTGQADDEARNAEQRLVERAAAGDATAFEQLVRANSDRLYAVILRFTAHPEEAEEVMQETLVRAWRSIGRFEGRSAFFTWIYRIAINESKRRAEKRRRIRTEISLDDSPLAEAPDWSASPELRSEQAGAVRELESAIAALGDEYRQAIVLRDLLGFSTREAAAAMEIGEPAFKSRLHRARMAVRRALDEYFSDGSGR